MNQTPQSPPKSRTLRSKLAVPFVAGTLAGATAIGGVAFLVDHDGSSTGANVPVATAPGTGIALSATLSAEQIYRLDSPGVVDISVTTSGGAQGDVSPFGPGGGSSRAEGTGFVYDTSGNVVTASHVVDGASAIQVRFKDGSVAKATLVGDDPSSDIAVIKVNVASSKLKPLALADSGDVKPGQGAVAILGAPRIAQGCVANVEEVVRVRKEGFIRAPLGDPLGPVRPAQALPKAALPEPHSRVCKRELRLLATAGAGVLDVARSC